MLKNKETPLQLTNKFGSEKTVNINEEKEKRGKECLVNFKYLYDFAKRVENGYSELTPDEKEILKKRKFMKEYTIKCHPDKNTKEFNEKYKSILQDSKLLQDYIKSILRREYTDGFPKVITMGAIEEEEKKAE